MRVISGKWRGRKLAAPEGQLVRPTSDRVKEAVFNRLRPRVAGSVWVDLFCGSGSIGIEALSNGAKAVYFFDGDKRSVQLAQQNLNTLGVNVTVMQSGYEESIKSLAKKGIVADIIYCDPPYRAGCENNLAELTKPLLASDGVLVVEHAKGVEVPSGALILEDTRRYGQTMVSYFRAPRIAVLTGTFDPFTLGHRYLAQRALAEFDYLFVVLLINPDKQMKYPLEKRLDLTRKSLDEFADRVSVEAYDGFAADYAAAHQATAIIRGFRNQKDLSYELEMARFNEERSGIPTVFYEAEQPNISSTAVREHVSAGLSVDGLVDEKVKKEL